MSQRFPITLTQLTYFSACAKTLNMTLASQELHVAQSAVSTAISHLERALDAPLFIRQHSKGLVLTSAGESLLRDTQRVFGLLSESIDTIRAGQNTVAGTVSVACFHTLTPFVLPELLGFLASTYPGLTVEVLEGDHEENLRALRDGRAELAISYDLTATDGITQHVVGASRPYALVSAAHPLAGRRSVKLSELSGEPFVLLDLPDSSQYFLDLFEAAGVAPHIAYRTTNFETVRSLVAMGLGFSLLNQRPKIETTYAGNSVAAVELTGHQRSLNVAVLSLAQVSQSARARAITEALTDLIADGHIDLSTDR